MIDFDEELKKFHPSLEIDDIQEAVNSHNEPDMLDLLFSMLGIKYKDKDVPSHHFFLTSYWKS